MACAVAQVARVLLCEESLQAGESVVADWLGEGAVNGISVDSGGIAIRRG